MSQVETLREQLNVTLAGWKSASQQRDQVEKNLEAARQVVNQHQEQAEQLQADLLREHLNEAGLSVCFFSLYRSHPEIKIPGPINSRDPFDYDYRPTKRQLRDIGIVPKEETSLLFVCVTDVSDLYKMFGSDYPDFGLFRTNYSTRGALIRVCKKHTPKQKILDQFPLTLENGLTTQQPTLAIIRETVSDLQALSGESFEEQAKRIRDERQIPSGKSIIIEGDLREQWRDLGPDELNPLVLNYFGIPRELYNHHFKIIRKKFSSFVELISSNC